jgi:hypothetical protein
MVYTDVMTVKSLVVEQITPSRAQQILEVGGGDNRKLRARVVKRYAESLLSGNWGFTHQGIALTSSGRCLDGQHRLKAIVLTGRTVPMIVCTFNENPDVLALPIDIGASRTAADLVGEDRKMMEVFSVISRVHSGGINEIEGAITLYGNLSQDKRDLYYKISGTATRKVSLASVRAAVFVGLLAGVDWTDEYHKLVLMDFEEMEPSTRTLFAKLMSISCGGGAYMRRMVYAYAVGCVFNSGIRSLRANQISGFLARALLVVQPYLGNTVGEMCSVLPTPSSRAHTLL